MLSPQSQTYFPSTIHHWQTSLHICPNWVVSCLFICLSNVCQSPEESESMREREREREYEDEYVIHQAADELPVGLFNLFSLHFFENCWLRDLWTLCFMKNKKILCTQPYNVIYSLFLPSWDPLILQEHRITSLLLEITGETNRFSNLKLFFFF